ncbi:hypothetical protein LJC56_12060, partial [Christensenellaceae bacterium OttesenSCG-928-K19]|nr:hypothetical protein [Christensenellaceae bacterium OttesenSCG-928-K19]
ADNSNGGTFSESPAVQSVNIVATEPWEVTKEAGQLTNAGKPTSFKAGSITEDGTNYTATYRLTVKHSSASANYNRNGRLDFLDYLLKDVFPANYPAGGGATLVDVKMKDPSAQDAMITLQQGNNTDKKDYTVELAGDGTVSAINITTYAKQQTAATYIPVGAPIESVYFVTVQYPVAPYIYPTNVDPADYIYNLKDTAKLDYTLVGNQTGNDEDDAEIQLGKKEDMKQGYPLTITKYIKVGDFEAVLDTNAQSAYGTATFWLSTDIAGNKVAKDINNNPVMQSATSVGADGTLKFTNMREGVYYLHERSKPSDDFNGLTAPVEITIKSDGTVEIGTTGQPVSVTGSNVKVVNEAGANGLGILQLTKKGVNPAGDVVPMQGVTFALVNSSGQVVDRATTDKNGYLVFHAVTPGNYKVVEEALTEELEDAGFELDTSISIDVVVESNKVKTVSTTNPGYESQGAVVMNYSPYGRFRILKTDTSGNALPTDLAGAEFALYDSLKKNIVQGVDGTVYSKIVVPNGTTGYVSGILEPGTYYLKETKAPDGYKLESGYIEVVVQPYTRTEIKVKNQKLSKLGILKYGTWGGKNDYEGIAGIEFLIYDQETGGTPLTNGSGNNIVLTSITDASGVPTLYYDDGSDSTAVTVVAAGTYWLEEVADSLEGTGYVPLTSRIKVEVPEGQTVAAKAYNTPNYGRIKIEKTNAVTNAPMKGVEFVLYEAKYGLGSDGNPAGSAVCTIVTDEQGIAISTLLKPGTSYYIVEKTPEGFKPLGDDVTGHVIRSVVTATGVAATNEPGGDYSAITIPNEGSANMEVKVLVKNEPLVGIKIVKTESTQKNGSDVFVKAKFVLYDKDPSTLTDEQKKAAKVGEGETKTTDGSLLFTG